VIKETSEMDLWDLEEAEAPKAKPTSLPTTRKNLSIPRKTARKAAAKTPAEKKPPSAEKPKAETLKPAPRKKKGPTKSGAISRQIQEADQDMVGHLELEASPTEPEIIPPIVEKPQAEIPPAPENGADDPPSPGIQPSSEEELPPADALAAFKQKLILSKVEKIGLSTMLVLLLGVSIFFLTHAIYRLPEEPPLVGGEGFPVRGQQFTISSAETYWRTPITEGPGSDTVRRGTKLIPVLKISVTHAKGALRVFFRNSEDQLVGDGLTRTPQGTTTLEIPATAGFDQLGMHAAYRAGEGKRWKVEVYEGPSNETPTEKFTKVYEAYITTELR